MAATFASGSERARRRADTLPPVSTLLTRVSRAALRGALQAPVPLLTSLSGGPIHRDGQTLDPQLAALKAAADRLPLHAVQRLPPPEARVRMAWSQGLLDVEPRPMEVVRHLAAPGPAGRIPIRLYQPRRAGDGLIVFFHGGGGVIGSVDSYDPLVRLIADETGCRVASVDYRLAPEHPHPAAIDDAEAAWRYLAAHAPRLGADPTRLALLGDSMGGYLCAHVERRARPAPRPALMALVYPLTDLTRSLPSHAAFGDGFFLTADLIDWFLGHYLTDPSGHRAASPLFFDDVAGAPPTLMVTAGFDPLRDEGHAYAERLRRAGADVEVRCHAGLVHGFAGMTGAIDAARAAVVALCRDLTAALAPRA